MSKFIWMGAFSAFLILLGTLCVYTVYSGATIKPVCSSSEQNENIITLAYSPDERYLFSCSFNKIIIWDLNERSNREVREPESHFECISVSPNGKHVAIGTIEGAIIIYDIETNKCVRSAVEHDGSVHCVTFCADGNRVISGGYDRKIILWDVPACKAIGSFLEHTGSVNAIVFAPSGAQVYTGGSDGIIAEWEYPKMAITKKLRLHNNTILTVAASPDGRELIVGGYNSKLAIVDLATDRVHDIPFRGDVFCASFSRNGKYMAACGGIQSNSPGRLVIWKTEDGKEVFRVEAGHRMRINSIAFKGNDTQIATGGYDEKINVWNYLR